MKNLNGKVAIVAGATCGVGKGVALELAEAGATVYATGRTIGGTVRQIIRKYAAYFITQRHLYDADDEEHRQPSSLKAHLV